MYIKLYILSRNIYIYALIGRNSLAMHPSRPRCASGLKIMSQAEIKIYLLGDVG